MKRSRLIPFFILMIIYLSGFSQKLRPIENSETVVQSIMAVHLQKRALPPLNYDFSAVANSSEYRNNISILTPHQYNLSRNLSPGITPGISTGFGNANALILGSTYETSTTLGGKKLTGTYVFDVMGNLVDYQLNISKAR